MAISVEGCTPDMVQRQRQQSVSLQGGWLFELEQAMLTQAGKNATIPQRQGLPEVAPADGTARLPLALEERRDDVRDDARAVPSLVSLASPTAPSVAPQANAPAPSNTVHGAVVAHRIDARTRAVVGSLPAAAERWSAPELPGPAAPALAAAVSATSVQLPPPADTVVPPGDAPTNIASPQDATVTAVTAAAAAAPVDTAAVSALSLPLASTIPAQLGLATAVVADAVAASVIATGAVLAGTGLADSGVSLPGTVIKNVIAATGVLAAQGYGKSVPQDAAESMGEVSTAPAGELPLAEREQYARRLLHLYYGADGVHAWIRDADIDIAQAQLLAQAMASELAGAGTPLSALTLNGRRLSLPNFSARSVEQYEPADAGDVVAADAVTTPPYINANGAV